MSNPAVPSGANDTPELKASAPSSPRASKYRTPQVEFLGHLTEVTQKSGPSPDMNQTSKPGGGGG